MTWRDSTSVLKKTYSIRYPIDKCSMGILPYRVMVVAIRNFTLLLVATLLFLPQVIISATPIELDPANPHYFLFHGKPTILITSGEHYGAVINRKFNYTVYLNTLQACGFNLTRTFTGTYREIPGTFGIAGNTLAPTNPGDFVCPWARSNIPGAGDGGNKFNLNSFNSAYFKRLKNLVSEADKRGIVVELTLFSAIYTHPLWAVNPMNAHNNIQGIGRVGRFYVYTLKHKRLLAVQEALVKKIVTELRGSNNVYYEICNEPYYGGVSAAWSAKIAAVIAQADRGRSTAHLIAQNMANVSAKITHPNSFVSIFNFHYATPEAVKLNYRFNCPIADDETGFSGKANHTYRMQAWKFMLAGGAVFDNLDYSYTVKHPNGTAVLTTSPGGGGPEIRRQLQILKEFLDGFDLIRMKPDNGVIEGGTITEPLDGNVVKTTTVEALAERGQAYAIYICGGTQADLTIKIPAGEYQAQWINTRTGKVVKQESFSQVAVSRTLKSPAYSEDIALRIVRTRGK